MYEYLIIFSGLLLLYFAIKTFIKPAPKPKPEKTKPKVEPLIPIQIYFGSQQGTAAKYAKMLSEEGNDFGFITSDIDLNDVDFPKELTEGKVGIFCLATHGEGDPTDNAKKFASWLANPQSSLKGFRFVVFGLGNTQYEHFNRMGRDTNKKLEEQGAIRIYKYGEGDDNASLEEDFNSWKQNLWAELKLALGDLIERAKNQTNQQEQPQEQNSLPTQSQFGGQVGWRYQIALVKEDEIDLDKMPQGQFDFQTKQFLAAKSCSILEITQLRQNEEFGSTLKIVIDTASSGMVYKTAMNLGVFPENDPQQVQEIANYLGEDLNALYKISELKQQARVKLPFPSPLRVGTILAKFCDFTGQVMKKTLKDLAELTENAEVKNRLEYLASVEGKNDYVNEIEKQKRTIFSIIQQYQLKVNLVQFIELCPRISPRLFTIASSSLKHPNHVHLADSLLIDTLPGGRIKIGLCSQHFLNLQRELQQGKSPKVRVDFRESSFKLPEDQTKSILMVGPGTGVAPFIGFLQEREVFQMQKQENQSKYILYFGCRQENSDFIFKQEILNYAQQKTIDELHIAFSRQQEKKVYVQDLIKQNQPCIKEAIEKGSLVIFICGYFVRLASSTSMGKDVIKTLVEIIKSDTRGEEEAMAFIEKMEKDKMLIKELW